MTLLAGAAILAAALIVALLFRIVLGSFSAIINVLIWGLKWIGIGLIHIVGAIGRGITRIIRRIRLGYW